MRFKHVISLGVNCPTARELARYGLRDASYPFDWIVCGIKSTTELLETHFDGHLAEGNLTWDPAWPNSVICKRTGFRYVHDFDVNRPIEAQLPEVREKYDRRINRLYSSMTEPTLFVRRIENEREFAWTDQNLPRVLAAIRQGNPKNQLLLVALNTMPNTCGGHRVYLIERIGVDAFWEFCRTNKTLHRKLLWLNYPVSSRIRRLPWLQKRLVYPWIAHQIRTGLRATIIAVIGEQRFQSVRSREK